jgi:hypothetical protein
VANQHIEISIIDDRWPQLKVIVNRDGQVQTVTAMYDGAFIQFETPVKNALQYAVEAAIKSHKGR